MAKKILRFIPLGACAFLAACNAPRAVDDLAVVPDNAPSTIDVLANDENPAGFPLMIKRAWGAQKGSVTINPDNTVTYSPRPGEMGQDQFQYRLKDNRGHANNAFVNVDITPRPLAVGSPPPDLIVRKETAAPASPVVVVAPPPLPPAPTRVMATPEPAPAISRGPFVQSVFVTLHTTGDDKNREEPVRLVVRRGNEILADRTVGAGELWGSFTDNSFELPLDPQPALADVSRLVLDVRKVGIGSPSGGGWTMQTEARARMSDGSTLVVLPMTDPVKMGDDATADRNWTFTTPK
jgi:hypothetical protein